MGNVSELWKDIPGYEGLYKISRQGRIKSLYTGKLRAQAMSGKGYKAVSLSKIGEKKRFYVHRLVAMAFLPTPPEGKCYINHKNLNKTDNRVENLEWVSHKENMLHAYRNGKTDFRKKKRSDNTSGIPGVSLHSYGCYQVTLSHKNRRYYGGFYHTKEEAIKARKDLERRIVNDETFINRLGNLQ